MECTYLKLQHPHPRDDDILFFPDTHQYFLRDNLEEELISCTTFWKDFLPAFPEQAVIGTLKSVRMRFRYWYDNRHQIKHPREHTTRFPGGPLWPQKYDTFIPLDVFAYLIENDDHSPCALAHLQPLPEPLGRFGMNDVRRGWESERDQGTQLHLDIERFLNRVPSPTPEYREWGYFMQFYERFHRDFDFIRTEMRLYHEDLGIAGSFDLLMRRKSDGVYALVDWKRSRRVKRTPAEDLDNDTKKYMTAPLNMLRATDRNKHTLQLNTYGMLCRMNYDISIGLYVLGIIHPENEAVIYLKLEDYQHNPVIRTAINTVMHRRKKRLARARAMRRMYRTLVAIMTTTRWTAPTLGRRELQLLLSFLV
jgi:hypothetical protein